MRDKAKAGQEERSPQVTAPAPASSSSSERMTLKDWIPQDDGIDAKVPGCTRLSGEDVSAYITERLYGGSRTKKRLPVFNAICPDEDTPTTTSNESPSSLPSSESKN